MEQPWKFSPLDRTIMPFYYAYIFGFPTTSSEESITSILQHGLSKMVAKYPFLNGVVTRTDGCLSLDVPEPAEEIKIIRKSLIDPSSGWKQSYQELQEAGMPGSKLDAAVLAPLTASFEGARKVIAAQANFIPGGLLLAMCFHHSMFDARSASSVVGLLATYCQKIQSDDPSSFPELQLVAHKEDASKYYSTNPKEYELLKKRPELWQSLILDQTGPLISTLPEILPAAMNHPGLDDLRMCIFQFSPASLAKLKERASESIVGWISTNDSVMAFVWRKTMQARFPSTTDTADLGSAVTLSIDGREALSIPFNYIGNVIFCSITRLPMQILIAPLTPISTIAQAIRHDVNKFKSTAILSDAFKLASCIPQADFLQRWRLPNWTSNESGCTSWVDLPFYELEWGPAFGDTGKMEFFRIPRGQFSAQGLFSIYPRQLDGSVEVIIGMKREDAGRLIADEEFSGLARLVSE